VLAMAGALWLEPEPYPVFALVIFQIESFIFAWSQPRTMILLFTLPMYLGGAFTTMFSLLIKRESQ
jgi:hypothetical protein